VNKSHPAKFDTPQEGGNQILSKDQMAAHEKA
jgi:hypothetical protein